MFPETIHRAVSASLRAAAAAGDLPELADLEFVVERPATAATATGRPTPPW